MERPAALSHGAAAVRYHQLRRARRKAFRWPLCWAVLVLLYALVSDLLAAPPAQPVGSTQPATPAPTARQKATTPLPPSSSEPASLRSTAPTPTGGGGSKARSTAGAAAAGSTTAAAAKGGKSTAPTPTLHSHPTLRPKRNCTPPAIEQFPDPLIGPYGRRHGLLIIHVALAVYTFMGLAIVCDDYFVSSLDRICEELKLSPDVAGATFMAAGSSAPELATVIIGVFFAKDDIGVSGVIGSAVFNIMFVISVCALCAGTVCTLNWFPLCRDCFWYALSILVMLFVICNDLISWFESLFMLLVYVAYCVSLHYNDRVEKWANTLPLPCKPATPDEEAHLVTYRTLAEDPNNPNAQQQQQYPDMQGNGEGGQPPAPGAAAPGAPAAPGQAGPQYYKPKEPTGDEVSPLERPVNASQLEMARWAAVYPIHYMCRLTTPDCRLEQYRRWYPFTFVISMIWISFYSYIMVWMITIIGSTLYIPDTVMGLTFVAAGVSVPDALSSLAVVKEGYGDMAVSNAVGSNVFDILVCLGLPWFMQTALIAPGSHVNVYSKGLTYSTLSLLSTVVFLVVATHMNGWKLDKKYGVILMLWYLFFISFASLYELNVFGDLNPPECESYY